jgi:hypothetical protein
MGEKQYGVTKVLYSVLEKPDGRIEVRVRHDNAYERRVVQAKRTNPRFFLDHLNTYKDSTIRARYWMAVVASEYRSHFATNRVDFVLGGNAPKSEETPTTGRQIQGEAKAEVPDTALVVEASRNLERLLRVSLAAQGRGLGEQLASVETKLSPTLRQELWEIVRIRNRLVHEQHVSLRALGTSQDQFRQLCARAERGLRALANRLDAKGNPSASRR